MDKGKILDLIEGQHCTPRISTKIFEVLEKISPDYLPKSIEIDLKEGPAITMYWRCMRQGVMLFIDPNNKDNAYSIKKSKSNYSSNLELFTGDVPEEVIQAIQTIRNLDEQP